MTSTAIHPLYITGMCPSTIMPPISHMSPTLLYTQVQKKPIVTLNYFPIAIYVPKNKYATQMPHICHICQLVYLQISDKYVSLHASHKLNVIKCGHKHWYAYTAHFGICPWANMPATLYIHIPLYCYCSLHIYTTLLSWHAYVNTYIDFCISAYIHT